MSAGEFCPPGEDRSCDEDCEIGPHALLEPAPAPAQTRLARPGRLRRTLRLASLREFTGELAAEQGPVTDDELAAMRAELAGERKRW